MTTRAYIRESTVEQGQKFGPDAQRVAIARACDELAIAQPEHWYTDLITGTGKTVRDSLAAARAAALAGEYDILVCYDTSRWARNEREAFDFEWEMKRAGVRVYFAAERIWADDDRTALHKGVLHVLNAQYSRDLSRRTRDGYAAKRAKGHHVGGIPWGYRRIDGAHLEPTELVEVRRLAWTLYASGEHTFATVADELNRRGHRIVHRGVERLFSRYTIEEFFKRRVDVEVGGLDPAIYERAREVAQRHRVNEHVGQRRHEYLFPGIARCAECGEPFYGRTQVKRAGLKRRQLVHAPRGCARGTRQEDRLERIFGEWLGTWSLPRENVAELRARAARFLRARSQDPSRDVERRQLELELERLRNLYRWGDLGEDDYRADSTRVRARLAELGPRIVAQAPTEEVIRLATKVGEAWAGASLPTRRAFLRAWVSELRIRRDGSIEVVPRPAVASIVYAALGCGTVGSAGVAPAMPHPLVTVRGLDEWLAFWAAEASA